jgi:hypothetical protein
VESHVSQKTRDMGHPMFVVVSAEQRVPHRLSARLGMTRFYRTNLNAPRGLKPAVLLVTVTQAWKACSTLAFEACGTLRLRSGQAPSARFACAGAGSFGALRLLRAGAQLRSCSSRWCRSQNPQRDGAVESHVSQKTRDMGHPWVVVSSGEQQVPHRAFSPIRNDKGLLGLAAGLKRALELADETHGG